MLVKYWLPVAVLVTVQAVWTSWVSADTQPQQSVQVNSGESKEAGDVGDLEAQELFLRPVVIKYGHDSPSVYTWQGASGVGQGWGVYSQTQGMQQGQQGWPKPEQKGWGKKKKGKKKKKKKKKKPKKKKKKKKPKKKKNKAWSKPKKKEEGGWGEKVEEGGWEPEKEKEKKKGDGWGEESSEEEAGWEKPKKKKKKKKPKKKKEKKKKGGDGWGEEESEEEGWARYNLDQGIQRYGGLPEDHVEYIPVVPADSLPFHGFDGYFQDAYIVP